MICSCDRPLPLADGACLKCGRETREHAEFMRVGMEASRIAREYFDAMSPAQRRMLTQAAR
jgi:hypothetical protein